MCLTEKRNLWFKFFVESRMSELDVTGNRMNWNIVRLIHFTADNHHRRKRLAN